MGKPGKDEGGWMEKWKQAFTWLGIPLLLAYSYQWRRAIQEDSQIQISIHPSLQANEDFNLGGFLLQWRNGTVAILGGPDRKYTLWYAIMMMMKIGIRWK